MITREQHTVWTEKYRPDVLENYIGNEHIKEKFAQFIEQQDVPHLLLVGPAGTGKTTAAKILVNNIDCDKMIINASDENNIETVRSKIRSFASTQSFKGLKIMILDEFDGFTRQGQEALRNLMEQFIMTTRFILTANYMERVIEPIVSRTQSFKVVPPSNKQVCIHLAKILKQEGVTFDKDSIVSLVDAYFPDIRKIVGEAQGATKDGVLKIDPKTIVDNDFKLQLLEILAGKSGTLNSRVTAIRQLLADADVRDYAPVYRYLFDHVQDYAGKNISAVIIALAEGQYKDSLVPDKEINAVATLINVIQATD